MRKDGGARSEEGAETIWSAQSSAGTANDTEERRKASSRIVHTEYICVQCGHLGSIR
jgi:hypothetical protein